MKEYPNIQAYLIAAHNKDIRNNDQNYTCFKRALYDTIDYVVQSIPYADWDAENISDMKQTPLFHNGDKPQNRDELVAMLNCGDLRTEDEPLVLENTDEGYHIRRYGKSVTDYYSDVILLLQQNILFAMHDWTFYMKIEEGEG